MSIDPSQILHIKGAVKTDLNLTTGAGSKIGVGVDAPDGVIHILHDQPTIVVAESGTNTSVGRLHANNHSLEIQAGLTSSADSKANIVFSSYGGTTKYIEIDGAGGGQRGNVHVNSDLRAPNVYANTLFLENLAIGEVVQGLNEVLNTNNEASNTIYISNATAATSLTTGALRVAGGISTQSNLHADAVYTANLFSTTDELNLSSDVVKLGNKIELGYGNADNSDHNIGLVMTARQKFWSNVATADIASPEPTVVSYFGYSLSVDRAGDRFLVGGHGSVYAYVYHRDPNTNTWPSTPTATFTAPNTGTSYGLPVCISPDGTRAFVGAPQNDEGGTDIGRLYVYSYENGAWNTTPVDLPGQAAGEQMGWAVACNEDGSVVAVGARYNDEGGTNYGRVYVFEETSGNWNTTPIVDIPGTSTGEEFGLGLGMNDAGTRIVVGTLNDDIATNAGKVYVFHKTAGGTWPTTATATFTGTGAASDHFGLAVAMNSTGTRIAATAFDYTRIYEYDSSASAWKSAHVAEFPSPDLGDRLYSCSMNDAGDRVAVGARYGGLEQQGTVYVHEEINGAWREADRFYGRVANARLGGGLSSVSLNGTGDVLVAGAYVHTVSGTAGVGRAYVFEQVEPSNVAVAYDGHDVLKIGFTSNVVTDTVVDTNTSNLNVEIAGDLTLTGSANVFVSDATAIHANSNVVAEFKRSKKLVKYPRVAMTAATSGGYTASASSVYNPYGPDLAFNNVAGSGGADFWHSNQVYTGANGAYSGSNSITDSSGKTYSGEHITLQLANADGRVRLHHVRMRTRIAVNADRMATQGVFLGSNDGGTTHDTLHVFAGLSWSGNEWQTIQINASGYYSTYTLVTEYVGSDSWLNIGEIEYYGVPETDPDAHGTDVIARSVPNVPNTDFLEVYYDGQDYGSMPSTITDKSGNSVTGTPTNGVTFDSTWKAFNFDAATNQYITATTTNQAGAFVHTVSMWVKFSELTSSQHFLFRFGSTAGAAFTAIGMYYSANQGIRVSTGVDYRTRFHPTPGEWVHIMYSYSGGTLDEAASDTRVKFYVNGVRWQFQDYYQSGSVTPAALNLPGTNTLQVNGKDGASNIIVDMSVANFRLFNRALTGDEAWQLYAYQKEYFQMSPDVVTFKGGRLGIGTEEPRAVLDVRGSFHAPGTVVQVVTNPIIGQTSYTSSSGADVNLAVLQTSVTPKFSNSKMVVQVYMSYEADYNAVLFVRANDEDIPSGRTYGSQEGTIPVAYDSDQTSTPNSSTFVVHHDVSSTQRVTYKVFYKVNGTGTIQINRGYSSVDEKGMCYVVIWEIAQ